MEQIHFICIFFMVLGKTSLLTTVKGEQVMLNSPQLSHGIPFTRSSTINPWRLSGNKPYSCPSTASIADSYYVLPYITTSPANEVAIDVTFTFICCSHILSIGLYAIGALSPEHIPPSPFQSTYRHVADLSNTSAIRESRSATFTVRGYVAVANSSYLNIALRSQGFCGTVNGIQVRYYKCAAIVNNLVSYPETIAPTRASKTLQIAGSCMQHSYRQTSAENFMICYSNGTSKITGDCQCIAGYQNVSATVCSACPPKTFKSSGGNFNCKVCGANVLDGEHPRIEICQCRTGHFRPQAHLNAFHVNCEEPPSEPTNIRVEAVNSSWASLTWDRPNKKGTGDTISYSVRYETKSFKAYTQGIKLDELSPFTRYSVTVSSENNVTAAIGVSRSTNVSFITLEGLPSMVEKLSYERNPDRSITVHWKEPTVKGSKDLWYAVAINKQPLKFVNVTKYTIAQKESTIFYTVRVSSYTNYGSSKAQTIEFAIEGGGKATSASSTVPTSTLSSTSTTVQPGIQRSAPGSAPRGTDNGIYIGISVGAVGGVGALALIIYYLRRRVGKDVGPPRDIEMEDLGQDNPGHDDDVVHPCPPQQDRMADRPLPERPDNVNHNDGDNRAYQGIYEEIDECGNPNALWPEGNPDAHYMPLRHEGRRDLPMQEQEHCNLPVQEQGSLKRQYCLPTQEEGSTKGKRGQYRLPTQEEDSTKDGYEKPVKRKDIRKK